MAYTTYSEIQADFKSMSFGSATNVKDTDVTQFIVEADALINAYVGTVYTVPVTSGDGVNLLKLLSRSLVTARIKKIMEVVQDKSTGANQNVVSTLLSTAQVMKILTDIQQKNLSLAGASALVSGSGFFSNNVDNSVTPVMEKDTKQW